MYAIDDLGDAIDVTRDFLTPVSAGQWLRLALVVFFVGGVGSSFPTPSGGGGTPPSDGGGVPPGGPAEIPDETLLLLGAFVALALLVGLVFLAIGSLMEFVLVESLRSEAVHVRRYGGRNLSNGIRLFLFRVGLGLVTLLVVGLPVLALYFSAPGFAAFSFGVVVALVLFALPVFVVSGVVSTLTTNFVVPTMLRESTGVIDGWRRFWSTLVGEWKEYVVYYLLAWILRLVVGIAVGIVLGIVGLVIGIPFLIVLFVLFMVPVLGPIFAILFAVAGAVLFVLIGALVQVPVVTYFRYYALLVLGDTDAGLDLISGQRRRVRGDGGASTATRDDPDDSWGEDTDEWGNGATDDDDGTGWNGDADDERT